jgi:hypothetical protein
VTSPLSPRPNLYRAIASQRPTLPDKLFRRSADMQEYKTFQICIYYIDVALYINLLYIISYLTFFFLPFFHIFRSFIPFSVRQEERLSHQEKYHVLYVIVAIGKHLLGAGIAQSI